MTSATSAQLVAHALGVGSLALGDAGDHLVVELLHDPEQSDSRFGLGGQWCLLFYSPASESGKARALAGPARSGIDALQLVQQLGLRVPQRLV